MEYGVIICNKEHISITLVIYKFNNISYNYKTLHPIIFDLSILRIIRVECHINIGGNLYLYLII